MSLPCTSFKIGESFLLEEKIIIIENSEFFINDKNKLDCIIFTVKIFDLENKTVYKDSFYTESLINYLVGCGVKFS